MVSLSSVAAQASTGGLRTACTLSGNGAARRQLTARGRLWRQLRKLENRKAGLVIRKALGTALHGGGGSFAFNKREVQGNAWRGAAFRTTKAGRRSVKAPAVLPETIFSVGTVTVMPLYGLMIAAPESRVVSKLTQTHLAPPTANCTSLDRCATVPMSRLIISRARLRHPRYNRPSG